MTSVEKVYCEKCGSSCAWCDGMVVDPMRLEIERLKAEAKANSIRRELFDATVNQATELKAQLAALREASTQLAAECYGESLTPRCWDRVRAVEAALYTLANTEAPAVRETFDAEKVSKLLDLLEEAEIAWGPTELFTLFRELRPERKS